MAVSAKKVQLGGLARKLVDAGLLEETVVQEAVRGAAKSRHSLVRYLVENKVAGSADIAAAASQAFGIPLIDAEAVSLDAALIQSLNLNLIKKHRVLPLHKRGKRIFVGISDPTNLQALDQFKFATGCNIEMVLVEEDKLNHALEEAAEQADTTLHDMVGGEDGLDDLDSLETVAEDPTEHTHGDEDIEDAPVVRFVNKIMLDAVKKGASDLHFEPYEKFFRVRFRVDGVLEEIAKPPLALSQKIAARIKVMSRLDVSERRVPQDGRIKLKLSKNKAIDFRVSTCPTLFGEKCCLRILDSDVAKLQIDQLGYEDFQKELFMKNLRKPYGMFLVTGPTGSGKTVSLYSGINILNQQDVNISTAEDPVEINLAGINQVQVDERTGMTFPKALKAFLRQDPDIILVGEIRDLETGSIAVKAAQTGHMVMSTLHTNDCPQTLTRLQDMGVPPFAVATSINLITAQRLARRLHPEYRKAVDVPKQTLLDEGFTQNDIAENFQVYEPETGNNDCPSGYKGRVGIYQVMPISETMKRMIMEGENAVTLATQAAKEKIPDIRRSGLEKVMQGMTSLSEINRVTVE